MQLLQAPAVAGEQSPLQFRLTRDGVPVTSYDTVHERPMHVMTVRETGQGYADFQHVHPRPLGNGTWQVDGFTALGSGRTLVFADFSSGGRAAQAQGAFDAVRGAGRPAPQPLASIRAAVTDAGRAASGIVARVQVADVYGQGVRGFDDYLGAPAHWALFARGADGRTQLVHAHATRGRSPGTLEFHVDVPAGVQALQGWLQVRPHGASGVQTVRLDLDARSAAAAGAAATSAASAHAGH